MRPSRERIGWFLLGLGVLAGLVAIGLRVGFGPLAKGNVYPVFSWAGRQWEAGRSPYFDHQHIFRYPPPSAVAFVPWGWLPDRLGSLLWRVFNGVLLVVAATRFVRILAPDLRGVPLIGFCFLVAPWGLANLNNGQANPLLLALLLLALASAAEGRWRWVGALLAGAVWLKLYPIALALLLLLWKPKRLGPWLGLFLAVGLGLPVATQGTGFVWDQYVTWSRYVFSDLRMHVAPEAGNRDFRQLVRLLGLPLPALGHQALQAASALGLAFLVWRLRPRSDAELRERLLLLGGLAVAWMLLFGPATESCTYLLLSPFLAVEVCRWERHGPWRRAGGAAAALALHAVILGSWISALKFLHFSGLQQFAALACALLWLIDAMRLLRQSEPEAAGRSSRIAFVASMRSQSKTATT